MKYIDSEKLQAEIERMREINRKALEADHIKSDTFHGRAQTLNHLFEFIISLQQEQPEVDLKKEVENFCLEYDARKEVWFNMTPRDQKMLSNPTWSNFAANIARHFYELGLNARKEE